MGSAWHDRQTQVLWHSRVVRAQEFLEPLAGDTGVPGVLLAMQKQQRQRRETLGISQRINAGDASPRLCVDCTIKRPPPAGSDRVSGGHTVRQVSTA
ncbi:MAG: hypothetical protein C4289_02755, partial [Chloroflexota bacterium]